MKKMRFGLPSPAMCVALVALVVSLGGNAIAASVMIRSSGQIGKGTVNTGDVRNGTLTDADVRRNALTSESISNLLLTDLRAGEAAKLKGDKGEAGEAGAPGATGSQGATGPQGPPGSNASFNGVAAGGDLDGTYPNPTIRSGAVGATELAADLANVLDANDIATGGVDDAELNDDLANTITANDIASGGVDTDEIAQAGVNVVDMGFDAGNTTSTADITVPARGCAMVSEDTGPAGDQPGDQGSMVTYRDQGVAGDPDEAQIPAGLFIPVVAARGNGDRPLVVCNGTGSAILWEGRALEERFIEFGAP